MHDLCGSFGVGVAVELLVAAVELCFIAGGEWDGDLVGLTLVAQVEAAFDDDVVFGEALGLDVQESAVLEWFEVEMQRGLGYERRRLE